MGWIADAARINRMRGSSGSSGSSSAAAAIRDTMTSSEANKISQSMYPNTTVGFSSDAGGAYGDSGVGSGAPNAGKTVSILDYLRGSRTKDDAGIVSGLYDSSSGGSGRSSASQLDYLDADWAAYYGMDRSTAYAEAMQNTSYQRTMKDMIKAGLNPAAMFGNGANTNTAFYMGSPASSGGGGGGGGSSRSSGSGKSNYLFSKNVYDGLGTLGGIAAVAITKKPYAYSSGRSIAQGVARGISSIFKK